MQNWWHAENRRSQKKRQPNVVRPGVWVGRPPPECVRWSTPCTPQHRGGPSSPAAARFAAGANRSPPMFRPGQALRIAALARGARIRRARTCRASSARWCARGTWDWSDGIVRPILPARGTRCFAAVSGALERIFGLDAEGVQNLAVRAGRGAAGEDRRECQLSVLQLAR